MKITGTKKLLIIFFAFVCAITVGFGVYASRPTESSRTAFAASDEHVLPLAEGEKKTDAFSDADLLARDALAKEIGLSADFVTFYARSFGYTEEELYARFLSDSTAVSSNMFQFAEYYSAGELTHTGDITDEDWYIAPDQVNSYSFNGSSIGIPDNFDNWYTSKAGGRTTEMQYYRNTGFQMGYWVKWDKTRPYANGWAMVKHRLMFVNIVWLEEGETYTFGYRLKYPMYSVFAETVTSDTFLTDTLFIRNWFTGSNQTIDEPDTSRNTLTAYRDEFGTTITPNNTCYTTSFNASASQSSPKDQRMTIKPDAPSGAYMIVAQSSVNDSSGNQFREYNVATETWTFNTPGVAYAGTYWVDFSPYFTYATLVCRKGITKPKLKYDDGVDINLTKKEVMYDGTEKQLVIDGDWGPGLENYVISEWDGTKWVASAANSSSAHVRQISRGTRGSVSKAGQLIFGATDAGKYKITFSSFRNWGDDESDRAPVSFEFTIKPRVFQVPSLVEEEGVNLATNSKYLYENGNTLYVNIYPAPKPWTTYTAPDLGEFVHSTNGVLTLSQSVKGKYTITISLSKTYNKFDSSGNLTQKNLEWEDGTTEDKVFTFEIGPRKITVPDIIKDVGDVSKFTKEVTFNGATQSISFMPVDRSQLKITAANLATGEDMTNLVQVKDGTLTFSVLDAGHYVLTVAVDGDYIFDDKSASTSLTYELIINEKEISAPIFNEPTAVGTVKTVTYGGEKMPDGVQDWVATLSFNNADESRIDWKSNTLGQQSWSDSTLVLQGRSAKTYSVTFAPKKNYKWEKGVVVPTYTLVINKLAIAQPELVNDGEENATYTSTSKKINFDTLVHPFKIYFPTLAALKNTNYTKASSVDIKYNGTFDREWDGDYVTYKNSFAGDYTFEVYPTQNYCWEDGTSEARTFVFIIQPISINSLEFWATNQFGTGLRNYKYNTETGYNAFLNYDGEAKTVRIGNETPVDDKGKFLLTGEYAKDFYLLDENGNRINDDSKTGIEAKLLDGMTCTIENGFLTLTMTTAGVYRVGVVLNNPNFWWKETESTLIVYTMTINPKGIVAPKIDESLCEGYDIKGHYTDTTMHGTYYAVDFALSLILDDTLYKDYIEIEDYTGKIYKFNPNRNDTAVKAELDAALDTEHGVYTDWYAGRVFLYARDQGEYEWKVRLTTPNYAWTGKTGKEIAFKLIIDRSPVSGLEMRYVGDEDEAVANGNGILVMDASNVRGNDANAQTVKYEAAYYSEKPKVIYFQRSDIRNLVKTGFSVQFSYEVNMFVMDSDYDVNSMTPVKVAEGDFNEDMLRMSALDAGTYEIVIRPTDNYCWNDNTHSTGAVKFTLVIHKLTIDTPLVILDDGTRTDRGVKNADYAQKYLTMQLDLDKYPKGYSISSFEYVSTDKNERDDIKQVHYLETETGDLNGTTINLGVDVTNSVISVQAQSAGEYLLVVVVSNINNYQLKAGDELQYRFNIARCSLSLPDAYIKGDSLDRATAATLAETASEVQSGATATGNEAFTAGDEGSKSVSFDGLYHSIYLYGDNVANGNFKIEVETKDDNGKSEIITVNHDTVLKDNTADNTQKAEYFRLSAWGVNVYTIKLSFVTRDFYWDKEISSSAETRSYKFTISKKLVNVPTIVGETNLALVNNKYTVEFPYVKNTSSDNSGNRLIVLENVEFGAEIAGTSPVEYTLINSSISAASTANGVILTNYPASGTVGTISMATSLDGTAPGEAQASYTYLIELNIDAANTSWNTGAEGDTDTKYYEIKITKQKVKRPSIIDTRNNTGDEKFVEYTGAPWVGTLNIEFINMDLIGYSLSNPTKMTATHQPTATIKDVNYTNLLTVDSPAPAGTYSVVATLKDDANNEWEDGTTTSITYSLIVNRKKVELPSIFIPSNSSEAQEGVIGRTKTVTYENVPSLKVHSLEILNYWATTADDSSLLDENMPEIMNYSVENGTFKSTLYTLGSGGSNVYNDGKLSFTATDAGKYIVRFTLTPNAVWVNNTDAPVDVILQINKKEHDNLFIAASTDHATGINGNTKSYIYSLDSEGAAKLCEMQIDKYDNSIMTYAGLVNGTASSATGDGYLESSGTGLGEINMTGTAGSYRVVASKAGDYEIKFTLNDPANHRWKFADVSSCTFVLNINKLKISQPAIANGQHKLANENIEGKTLTVDYDKRLHTILIDSKYAELGNGNFTETGAHYFNVVDATTAKNTAVNPSYNPATHLTFFKQYDDTSSLKVRDLFEDTTVFTSAILPTPYVYTGFGADSTPSFTNLFRLTAYTPGEYYVTFTLVDTDNMEWADETGAELEYKIIVNKVVHDIPALLKGTSTSLEYTGDKIEFSLQNVFNGKLEEGGAVVGTESERYEVVSYSGPRTDVASSLATTNFQVRWSNGVLVLGFTEIGEYTVRVSITDPNYIAWKGTTDTSRPFVFRVVKRKISAKVEFSASGDDELNAELQAGKTKWPVTVKGGGVDAQIVLSGLRDVPSAATWDQRLSFKVYYESVSVTGERNTLTLANTDKPVTWTVRQQIDGTYNLTAWYFGIDNGKGNIAKGKYNLCIVQLDSDGNHELEKTTVGFEIEADPAPFKKDMLLWSYSRSDDPAGVTYPIIELGQKPDNRFTLDYEEGISYTFHAQLNAEGQAGFDKSKPATFKAQLNTWFVDWDGSYNGTRSASNAGDAQVSIKITALNPNEYSFADYDFTLYYKINKAKYDLSGLKWDYNGSTPFVYDGTNKSVNIKGTMPTGLTLGTYKTKGTFVSGSNPVATIPSANTNQMQFAGKYETEASFTVPANSNYELPVMGKPDTYTGTFDWTREWEIKPQHIEVDWVQGQSFSSNGDVVTASRPSVAGVHAGKFGFIYEVEDTSLSSGWRQVNNIERPSGAIVKYRATAYLKGGSGATDYARNYTFAFIGGTDPEIGNPLEFYVGGNETIIVNRITMDGKDLNATTAIDFEYKGSAFTADTVIDLDTSYGQITKNNIQILYYKRDTTTNLKIGSPIAAPTELGNYIVVLKLQFSGTTDYKLSVSEGAFNIVTKKLKSSDFEWHIKHNDGAKDIEARFDLSIGGKWVDIATQEEFTVDYDGKPYELVLTSSYPLSVISFMMVDASKINAGTYTSTANETIDPHYEFDPSDPIALMFTWTIEKHFLDLKDVAWNYEEPFVYTLVNGKPKAFSAVIENVPEYLSDKVEYTVMRGTEPMLGDVTDYGTYETTVAIKEEKIDAANYTLGTWPEAVAKKITWNINRRELEVPENDLSWTEFDGAQHDLLKPFGFDVDWKQYFDVDVAYIDEAGNVSAYDGSSRFGGKYYAFNAGEYRFTLKIRKEFNSETVQNIVWVVDNGTTVHRTANDQTVAYTVAKKVLKVTGWFENYEFSHVLLAGNIDPNRFIEYKFYQGNTGSAGTPATLDDVLDSGGGDTFSMVPEVRKEYSGNITLNFDAGTEFVSFVTLDISDQDAEKVNGKPYIYGYSVDGVITRFSNAQLAAGDLSVTYTGKTVTFLIYDWASYYSKYVTVLGGSLDDLTQADAGEYSLTLVLRKDLEKPLYWGMKADNKIDRGSVTLKYKICYKMLTIPEIPAEVTYDGSEINILDKAANAKLKDLLAEYGDYVTVSGNLGTDVGEQTLYLKIKDEYGAAIRWDNKTEQGVLDDQAIAWKIVPILIAKPEKDNDARISYDGQGHSVFEVLKGYDEDNPTPQIALLMAYIDVVFGRSVDAGNFEAELSLHSANFAWCDASGKQLEDRSSVVIPWSISKQVIDFDNAYWGYTDGETEVRYDPEHPFIFTIANGAPKKFSVEILGMPEILKAYTSYRTGGKEGVNYASDVGTFTTTVQFDTERLDKKNFEIGVIPDSISQLVWKIEPREIAHPEFDGSWTTFDGKLHDLTKLLNLDDDWIEYLNISVAFKVNEGDPYEPYNGENNPVVGYSDYNGFYFGFYKLTVSLKNSGSAFVDNTKVKWAGGVAPQDIVIEVSERTITITGWFDDGEYSTVVIEDNEVLNEELANKLHYVIFADGDLDKTPLKPEDVSGGSTYYIEYAIKQGKDDKGVDYSYGIKLELASGVSNPYEFGSYEYGDDWPIIWLPAPKLETATMEYTGDELTFEVSDFKTLYKLTDVMKAKLKMLYDIDIEDSVKSFVFLQNEKSLTATAADTYNVVLRLLSQVRLSWYDSTLYALDIDGNLTDKSGNPIENAETLFNNKAYKLTYTITPKQVPALTADDLELFKGIVLGYDGTEKDVLVAERSRFAELEAKYGKIFAYSGNKGTSADTYELVIKLADPDSCSWYVGEPENKVVKADGFEYRYVKEGGGWALVLVKVTDGKPELDSSGNFIEFNNGKYELDVKYTPEFEKEYVLIKQTGDADILNADGTINTSSIRNYLIIDDDKVKLDDGSYVMYEYEMDATDNTKAVRYRKDATLGYLADPAGDYVYRYTLGNTAGDYVYKIPVTANATEYSYLFDSLTIDTNGVPVAPVLSVDDEGNKTYIDTYLYYDGSKYILRKYDIDGNGKLVPNGSGHYAHTVIEATCNIDDTTVKYSLVGGKFVESSDGEYMLRNVLEADGTTIKQQIVYAKDKNGNLVVDADKTVVKVPDYKPFADGEYRIEWKIDSSILAMPVFDESLIQQYTGGKLYAKDVLKGFLPDLMEIVEGGEGVEAGEYTAKIVLTTTNSIWNPEDTTENYVLVKWYIDTARVEFGDIKWVFTDGESTYDDSSSFVYTLENGKPKVFWVDIANLPEVLKGRVIFTTNGKVGAYAGNAAGKYLTTVEFDIDENFDSGFAIPETFSTSVIWNIARRVLDVPSNTSSLLVFDSEAHDLLSILNVPEYWNEYYDIKVQYAADFVTYVDYEGHDGKPFEAFGSGAYKFTFTIKTGINTTLTNPNVVWAKHSETPEPPAEEVPDDSGSGDTAG